MNNFQDFRFIVTAGLTVLGTDTSETQQIAGIIPRQ